MDTKTADLLSLRYRTALKFERCKGRDSFWDVQAGGVIWMVSK